MRRSRGFASTATNLFALFRLAFASAPEQNSLTLLMTVSRRIIMQKARRHPVLADIGLRPLVGMWFQVHYPPLIGVLPIFRSRYLVRYGSPASTQPRVMDPADSIRLLGVRVGSGARRLG